MPLAVGARIGPYEILASLGAGGMGEVYHARDPRLERAVAIKILTSARGSTPIELERFQREARAIARSITLTSVVFMTLVTRTASRTS